MADFIISTETTTDLPESYIAEHDLTIMSLTYTIDGETYERGHDLDVSEFYARMRAGSMPTTSQVNIENATIIMEDILKNTDKDILHIAFSSGISGTYNSVSVAAAELREKYPDRKIIVIDSLCASLGEGLIVHKAVEMKESGASIDEIATWLEAHKLNFVHMFTVSDLFHLHRSGRVSKTSAILGTMINIKPVLHVDDEGHLVVVDKVRGRKKSLNALVESMVEKIDGYEIENDCVFISHGDSINDAEYVAEKVKEMTGIDTKIINHIGPTIGTHSGPDTIALFFMGKYR